MLANQSSRISLAEQKAKATKLNRENINHNVLVFPFEIVNGIVNVSNVGIMPIYPRPKAGDYTFFQKVFTGERPIQITWIGSTYGEKPQWENKYIKNLQTGAYFYGKPLTSSGNTQIDNVVGNTDFLGMKSNREITLYFDCEHLYANQEKRDREWGKNQHSTFNLIEDDMFHLYLLPEVTEGAVMVISGYSHTFDEKGRVSGIEITFTTLSDKLQESGRAIEQYVNYGAPGEGYAYPSIYENTDYDKKVFYDAERAKNIPIRAWQIEFQGTPLFCSAYCMGRPCRNEQDLEILPPRHLMNYEFLNPNISPLNRTSSLSQNYFWLANCQLDFHTETDVDVWDIQKDLAQQNESISHEGFLFFDNDFTNTNSKNNGMYNEYNNPNWEPFNGESGSKVPTYSANIDSPYCSDDLTVQKTDSPIQIINKNNFAFNSLYTLPLGYSHTKIKYSKAIPIIGGMLNSLGLGDFSTSSISIQSASPINGMVDCSMALLLSQMAKKINKENSNTFFLNSLASPDNTLKIMGTQATNSTFAFALSDIIDTTSSTTQNIGKVSSALLGQTKYENGGSIFPDDPLKTFKFDSNMKFVNPGFGSEGNQYQGYIIDYFVIQAIFKGTVRISFYSDLNLKYSVYSTTLQSSSQWSNSIRDWTTDQYLSNWDTNNTYSYDAFTWPQSINETISSKIIAPINFSYNFGYEENTNDDNNDFAKNGFNVIVDKGIKKIIAEKIENRNIFSLNVSDYGYDSVEDFLNSYHVSKLQQSSSATFYYQTYYKKHITGTNPKIHFNTISSLSNISDISKNINLHFEIHPDPSTWETSWNLAESFGMNGSAISICDIGGNSDDIPKMKYQFGVEGIAFPLTSNIQVFAWHPTDRSKWTGYNVSPALSYKIIATQSKEDLKILQFALSFKISMEMSETNVLNSINMSWDSKWSKIHFYPGPFKNELWNDDSAILLNIRPPENTFNFIVWEKWPDFWDDEYSFFGNNEKNQGKNIMKIKDPIIITELHFSQG